MIYQVRLYNHHDNDLIQLYLNGISLPELFKKTLSAHFYSKALDFELPKGIEFKEHKAKVYRIKINFDNEKEADLIAWLNGFQPNYKNHCIKNIARLYIGSLVIDRMNRLYDSESGKHGNQISAFTYEKSNTGKEFAEDDADAWLDEISRGGTQVSEEEKEKFREKIRNIPMSKLFSKDELTEDEMGIDTGLSSNTSDHTNESKVLFSKQEPNATEPIEPEQRDCINEAPQDKDKSESGVIPDINTQEMAAIPGSDPEPDDEDYDDYDDDDFDPASAVEEMHAK